MAGWLRKTKDQLNGQPLVDPREVDALLPASVKQPELNRFTPLETDIAEGEDGDIEFINSLLTQVEKDAAPTAASAPSMRVPSHTGQAAAARINAQMVDRSDDNMQAFRDMASQKEVDVRMHRTFTVPDVEMSDLLEELSTVAAAMRQRKAA